MCFVDNEALARVDWQFRNEPEDLRLLYEIVERKSAVFNRQLKLTKRLIRQGNLFAAGFNAWLLLQATEEYHQAIEELWRHKWPREN